MPPATAIVLIVIGLLGHIILWVSIVNRTHAYAWPRWIIDGLTLLAGILLPAIPVGVGGLLWFWRPTAFPQPWTPASIAVWTFIVLNSLFAVFAIVTALSRKFHPERRRVLYANHTTIVDVSLLTDAPLTAPGIPTIIANLPRNEVVQPHFQEKRIVIPRLQSKESGEQSEIKLAHLTDFHMSGRITKQYFVEVIKKVNTWEPDLIVLTGDLVECDPCLDWIADTFGQLRAKQGVYFVLGNHDRHVDSHELRARLTDTGLIDLGGHWLQIKINGLGVVLAGSELPWFTPAADLTDCPKHSEQGEPLRVLLSHSPDQFGWAQENEIDLILAGHCHGGQVCFPIVGAVLAPSVHGTRYTEGIFGAGQTVMHVSRGVSGLAPFRWNCPPEVSLLTLCGRA